MRVIFLCCLCWGVLLSNQLVGDTSSHEAVVPPEDYELVWSDEFESSSLDRDKWALRIDNKHRSIQREENVSLQDGKLVLDLKVLEKPIQGKKASGAGIVSKQRFRYGFYEVRARLGISDAKQRGWHHSFWAQAATIDDKGYVGTTYPDIRRTEIDCYENPTEHRHEKVQNGLSNFSQHVIVWNAKGKEAGRLPKPPADVTKMIDFDAGSWHTYAFWWTPEEVRFFVDGKQTKVASYSSSEYEHTDVNLWITAISANWNYDQQIPSRAEYDYVRCYGKAK